MGTLPPLSQVAQKAYGAVLGVPFQWYGRLQGNPPNVPSLWSGKGIPSATTITGRARKGDVYFNTAVAGGVTNIYICSTEGSPGTWTAIA